MCVLTSSEIKERIERDGLIRDYIDLDVQLQPNGFDCTLRSIARIRGVGRVDFDNKERKIPEVEEIDFQNWVYLPRGVYRAYINEVIKLSDDLMAIGRPRSSIVRCGANILTAVWDAGYEGRSEVSLVVYNDLGLWLKRNARIMQLIFLRLKSKTNIYSGIYKYENI
ncbi:deoxyuridine 5'-triphosphate nucleotidohydrolase [Archaeoglobales archaeon]|nr:MAG: deoxyuridine 5'-triphosphate nucleotidohydrolase [Archaeoglobales archaeon ex4484_92]RLI76909.1 MAG: deoxyuridine 5'-triphosphate nucleotidohydrolase [Archaeoglobales archaeon]